MLGEPWVEVRELLRIGCLETIYDLCGLSRVPA